MNGGSLQAFKQVCEIYNLRIEENWPKLRWDLITPYDGETVGWCHFVMGKEFLVNWVYDRFLHRSAPNTIAKDWRFIGE